jgi:hypothetical protein
MVENEIQCGSYTGWELEQLQNAGQLPNVNFYPPGGTVPLPNPFVPWGNMDEGMIFQSERMFMIESYAASHGLLLLRGNRTNSIMTTVDVLFRDVRAMDVRAWSEELKIELQDGASLKSHPSKPLEMLEPGLNVYRLSGRGWSGFVIASRVDSKEGSSAPKGPEGLFGAT